MSEQMDGLEMQILLRLLQQAKSSAPVEVKRAEIAFVSASKPAKQEEKQWTPKLPYLRENFAGMHRSMAGYKELMRNSCANSKCRFGVAIECHHIIPRKHGGPDDWCNYISLCRHCHRRDKLHSRWEAMQDELFRMKIAHEHRVLGGSTIQTPSSFPAEEAEYFAAKDDERRKQDAAQRAREAEQRALDSRQVELYEVPYVKDAQARKKRGHARWKGKNDMHLSPSQIERRERMRALQRATRPTSYPELF